MLLGESFAAEVLGDTAEEVDPEVWEDITENDLTIRVEKEVQVQLPWFLCVVSNMYFKKG